MVRDAMVMGPRPVASGSEELVDLGLAVAVVDDRGLREGEVVRGGRRRPGRPRPPRRCRAASRDEGGERAPLEDLPPARSGGTRWRASAVWTGGAGGSAHGLQYHRRSWTFTNRRRRRAACSLYQNGYQARVTKSAFVRSLDILEPSVRGRRAGVMTRLHRAVGVRRPRPCTSRRCTGTPGASGSTPRSGGLRARPMARSTRAPRGLVDQGLLIWESDRRGRPRCDATGPGSPTSSLRTARSASSPGEPVRAELVGGRGVRRPPGVLRPHRVAGPPADSSKVAAPGSRSASLRSGPPRSATASAPTPTPPRPPARADLVEREVRWLDELHHRRVQGTLGT